MNKQEILLQIKKTIKGQGSAVDVGGKLAAILESIVDLIPEEPEDPTPEIPPIEDDYGQITEEELSGLRMYSAVKYNNQVLFRIVGCLNMAIQITGQPTLSAHLFNILENFGTVSRQIADVFGSIAYSGEENVIEGFEVLAFTNVGEYIFTEL